MTEFEPVFFDIETTGFNPMAQAWHNESQYAAQVTCVAMGAISGWRDSDNHEDAEYQTKVRSGKGEYPLLQTVTSTADDIMYNVGGEDTEHFLVSYNGRQFDHPYLGARFARLRQDGWPFTHGVKRLDMMRALGKRWESTDRYPSQDDCLDAAGIESDDPLDGSDMPEAFGNGNFDKIESHARADCEDMMRLFVETKEPALAEFSDHYDSVPEFNFVEELDF